MSNIKAVFTGTVLDGSLKFDNIYLFKNHLAGLAGRRVEITVDEERRKRTNNQNAYYWGICIKLIADHTGAEPEEIHEALKLHFCQKRFVGNLVAPSSTARLDTIDFETYLEKVRVWAQQELGVSIPLPNEVEVNH